MEEDNVVLSYGGEEDLPEITIRKNGKVRKNGFPSIIMNLLYEEGKKVCWIYFTALIIYFSAVALEVRNFLSYSQESVKDKWSLESMQGISYEAYIIRYLFTIKSIYIGLGILIIIAAGASVILWYRGRKDNGGKYKMYFTEIKGKRIIYSIRFFISFLGYLAFIGGYFTVLYTINSLAIKSLNSNIMEGENIMRYMILYSGTNLVIPAVYANRYIIIGGILTSISLVFLGIIAKFHKGYKIATASIVVFFLLGITVFYIYKNEYLYHPEKRLLLMGILLLSLFGSVFITLIVSKKDEGLV